MTTLLVGWPIVYCLCRAMTRDLVWWATDCSVPLVWSHISDRTRSRRKWSSSRTTTNCSFTSVCASGGHWSH